MADSLFATILNKLVGPDKPLPIEMQEGIAKARAENPDMGEVRPYGPISNLVHGDNTYGYAGPGNTIYVNPRATAGQSAEDWADTLTHEHQHIKHRKEEGEGGLLGALKQALFKQEPYHRRPTEMAAFQAERQRRNRMGREPVATPNFEGVWRTSRDVNLPAER